MDRCILTLGFTVVFSSASVSVSVSVSQQHPLLTPETPLWVRNKTSHGRRGEPSSRMPPEGLRAMAWERGGNRTRLARGGFLPLLNIPPSPSKQTPALTLQWPNFRFSNRTKETKTSSCLHPQRTTEPRQVDAVEHHGQAWKRTWMGSPLSKSFGRGARAFFQGLGPCGPGPALPCREELTFCMVLVSTANRLGIRRSTRDY